MVINGIYDLTAIVIIKSTMEQEDIVVEPPLYFAPNGLHIWNTHFHPHQNVLAAPLINGHLQLLAYSEDDVHPLATITEAHRASARHCRFNPAGTTLATCGQDKRLGFIDSEGKVAHLIKKAHPTAINRVHFANDYLLISGDDDGMTKVWDLRTSEAVFEAHDQSQAITGLFFDEEHTNVIASCLDGTIAVYDIRQGFDSPHKLYARTDSADEELHGLEVMKNGKYLLCPSSEHSVLVYQRDNLITYVDRIQQQPGSVQSILKIDEDTFLTGSEDGFVRAFSLKPNKFLRVVGQHEEDQHFPVQSLAISRCKNIVASTSHDNSIKFYDVSQLVRQRAQPRPHEEEEVAAEKEEIEKIQLQEDSDIFEDASDSDDMDSEQEQDEKPKGKKKKKKNQSIKERETELKKQGQRKFFQGL